MTEKDNRSNMEQLDPVNLCGQMAAFLLESGCLACHDGLLFREGMDFDFDLGFDSDPPVPDDKGTQGDSSS